MKIKSEKKKLISFFILAVVLIAVTVRRAWLSECLSFLRIDPFCFLSIIRFTQLAPTYEPTHTLNSLVLFLSGLNFRIRYAELKATSRQ
jgi:uncharacterized membrane protein YcgQ (UPF0703/DUF1980 family)